MLAHIIVDAGGGGEGLPRQGGPCRRRPWIPQGWEQRLDPKGGVYYYHPTTGMSLNQHPLDHHYQQVRNRSM